MEVTAPPIAALLSSPSGPRFLTHSGENYKLYWRVSPQVGSPTRSLTSAKRKSWGSSLTLRPWALSGPGSKSTWKQALRETSITIGSHFSNKLRKKLAKVQNAKLVIIFLN